MHRFEATGGALDHYARGYPEWGAPLPCYSSPMARIAALMGSM